MARRTVHIDVEVIFEESDCSICLEKWRRATEILLLAMERKALAEKQESGLEVPQTDSSETT